MAERESLVECSCGQVRPANGRCPWHEGPGVAVVAPMQVQGALAGPPRCQGCGVAGVMLWGGRCRGCHDPRNGRPVQEGPTPRTVTLSPAPHSCGGQGQADHLYRELCAAQQRLVTLRAAYEVTLQREVALHADRDAERRRADDAETVLEECRVALTEAAGERDEYLAQRDAALDVAGSQNARAVRAERERDAARGLLSMTHARCHYCGTSVPMSSVPRHAAACPQHPLGEALEVLRRLRRAFGRLRDAAQDWCEADEDAAATEMDRAIRQADALLARQPAVCRDCGRASDSVSGGRCADCRCEATGE